MYIFWERVIIFLMTATLLSGCSANHHSIYRLREIKGPGASILTADAKQRSIIMSGVPLDADGKPDPKQIRRFCSEPSPDVFSVIAQALSVGGTFGQGADPASLQIALNLAFSSAEQGSTIPRTQTINMLREMMFRTCERYLNGVIDGNELPIQAIRDQRLMVSILGIEQLTGAITPRPVAIGATAGGAAGLTGEAIVRLDEARKSKESAETAYTTALSNYEAKNGEGKICDAIKGKAEADLTTEQKPNFKPCGDLQKKKDEALAQRTTATAHHAELSSLARAGGVTAQTAVSSTAEGGIDRADTGSVQAVAKTVETIVAMNFAPKDEFLFFCMKAELIAEVDPSGEIRKACVSFILAGLEQAAQAQNDIGLLSKRAGEVRTGINAMFDIFWTKVVAADGRSLDQAKLAQLIAGLADKPVGPALTRLNDLQRATDKASALAKFTLLNGEIQAALAN